ncbi:hypothetical protein ES705_32114 [subsurface metagenome]
MTYADANLPIGRAEQSSLCKRDVQLFLKRIRKHANKSTLGKGKTVKVSEIKGNEPKIRYYIVGEYGTKTNRPHYHGLYFNLPVDIISEFQELWKLGFVYIGSVTDASIHYVTSYIINRQKENEGIENSFSIMSRKPGIGNSYLEDAEKWHKKGLVFYVVNEGGFRQRIPRYYKRKIFSETEIEINNLALQLCYDDKERKEIEKRIKKGENPFKVKMDKKLDFKRSFKKSNKNQKL